MVVIQFHHVLLTFFLDKVKMYKHYETRGPGALTFVNSIAKNQL